LALPGPQGQGVREPAPQVAIAIHSGLDERAGPDDRSPTMKTQALTILCVLGAALSSARADTPRDDGAEDQLTLPKNRFVIDAFLVLGISDGANPFSISPDVWYGVTDKLTVGLVHSSQGQTGLIGGTATTLCIDGESNGCAHVYQNLGLEARYQLPPWLLAWALDGGFYFRSFDPVELGLKAGAVGRWHSGKLAIETEPALYFGLTNRHGGIEGATATPNGEHLILPVTGIYTFMPKMAASLQIGVDLPFQDTGDTWSLPVSLGFHYLVTEKLEMNFSFTLTRLAGGGDAGAFDGRALTLGGSYAL